MARNRIGPKKVEKLRDKTGLSVLTALTRGNTDHRIDLYLDDGSVHHLYKDGTIEKSEMQWNVEDWNIKNSIKEA